MKLDDVELQQTTGFVIAKGSLKIGSEIDGGAHSHLLLSSQQDVTTVWPVSQVKRDAYGFCEATLGEVGLAFRSLGLGDIGMLSSPKVGRRSLTRGGSQVGELRRRVKLGNGWVEKRASPIQYYELASEYGPEGLHIEISGQVAATEGEAGKPFSIDTMLPWPTMAVKAIPWSVAYWKFGPQGLISKLDSVNRSRDPRKLGDLLLPQGLTWPYLKGRISFTPEPSWPSPSESAHDFVSIHFDSDQIRFSDARKLEVLDTGFAYSFAGLSRSLTLAIFDRGRLERAFGQRDAISIRLEGDAIGSVGYLNPHAEEPGDRLGWISQTIRTMLLKMALGKDGLEISADGELDDFDPREKRNSQLRPLHAYSVRATMPWALLVARGFSFAHRARNF